jgi:hypothetical protein
VNKKLVLAASGIILVVVLFFFGRTVPKKNKIETAAPAVAAKTLNISEYISSFKQKLTPAQVLTLGKLENSVTRAMCLPSKYRPIINWQISGKTVFMLLSLMFIIYLPALNWIIQKKTSPLLPN